MDRMTLQPTVHQYKRNIKLHINSIKANQTQKIRYAREKTQLKNRIVQLFQIS